MTTTTLSTEFLAPVWTHTTKIQTVRGEGVYLYDAEGNQYLDFTSGIGVTNTGHCHPRVVQAVQNQAKDLLFGQINITIPATTLELTAKLNEITPPHLNRFFLANSGAEATEASVKLAKCATGRTNIIVFQGSFHGRTHMAMAMTTSKTVYRHKYQPLPSGIFIAPFPYSYYYGWDDATTVEFCKKQLDYILTGQTAPDETAAIIIEPVMGEGGYVPVPPAFLHHLRAVCDKHGIVLIIDEVQTGFGRTGKLFCHEYAGIKADILVMAKGLGSGMPISGIASTEELMNKWTPGTHGGTYGGGSLLSTAAALETIKVIEEEGLVQNAYDRGEQLMDGLRALQKRFPVMGDVRGLGLMVGVEFKTADGKPDDKTTSKIVQACLDRNMLIISCGSYKNVLRWIPPLVVTAEQIKDGLTIFEEALNEIA